MKFSKFIMTATCLLTAACSQGVATEEDSPVAEAQAIVVDVRFDDGRQWAPGHHQALEGNAIWEYILAEETMESWTELFTIQYLESPTEDLMQTFAMYRQGLGNAGVEAHFNVIAQGEDSVTYTADIRPPEKATEYEVARLLKVGKNKYNLVRYTTMVPREANPHYQTLLGALSGIDATNSSVATLESSTTNSLKTASTTN